MDYLSTINDPFASREERLSALGAYEEERKRIGGPVGTNGEINNHIHTIYSFSPYTPSMAALRARDSGLEAAGSVDHDSISAAEEMVAACSILGIGACVGFEVRVSFKTGADGGPSPFAGKKINNPDSEGFVYMTVQGVPAPAIPRVHEFLLPIRTRRNERNLGMITGLNAILSSEGIDEIDFSSDVFDRSKAAEGGGVTERHLLAAVAEKLMAKWGKGPQLTAGLERAFGIKPAPNLASLLGDPSNPHYHFDLLGILKTGLLPRVFIQPDGAECVPARTAVDFARSIGAIPAYAYLGDVEESPTGDKRAEKFEDDYLEDLFDELGRIGYRAVTYMPPRNRVDQLKRVQRLCADRGFMEISGVDINSSRQSFNCPEVLRPEYRHLIDTTWALIAHERLASVDSTLDLFSTRNPLADLDLDRRLAVYAAAGRNLDRMNPAESASEAAHTLLNGSYIP